MQRLVLLVVCVVLVVTCASFDAGGLMRDPFMIVRDRPNILGSEGRSELGMRDPFSQHAPVALEPVVEMPVGDGSVNVKVIVSDLCWLEVYEDGQRVIRDNIVKGSELEFSGHEVRLEQVGREWAVRVIVNGVDVGVLADVSEDLVQQPLVVDDVRISLERRYPSRVLVGLSFIVIE